MRSIRLVLLATLLTVPLAATAVAQDQYVDDQNNVGVGPAVVPAPVVYGPPVCEWGYYAYYPYACAPYGYYGPNWFYGGVFIGTGPWYHRGWGRGGYGYRGGYGGRGAYAGGRAAYSGGGYRGGYGGTARAFNGGGARGGYAAPRGGFSSGGHAGGGFSGGGHAGGGFSGGGHMSGGGGGHMGGGGGHR